MEWEIPKQTSYDTMSWIPTPSSRDSRPEPRWKWVPEVWEQYGVRAGLTNGLGHIRRHETKWKRYIRLTIFIKAESIRHFFPLRWTLLRGIWFNELRWEVNGVGLAMRNLAVSVTFCGWDAYMAMSNPGKTLRYGQSKSGHIPPSAFASGWIAIGQWLSTLGTNCPK